MYDFLHVTNILSNGCSNRCDCFWRVRVFSRSQCLPVQIYNTIIPGGKMAVSMEKTLINAKIWVFQSQHGILLLEKVMIPQDWLTWWLDDLGHLGIPWWSRCAARAMRRRVATHLGHRAQLFQDHHVPGGLDTRPLPQGGPRARGLGEVERIDHTHIHGSVNWENVGYLYLGIGQMQEIPIFFWGMNMF